ncbi:MAG: CopD family protein [Inquilinaceae bacterium]
MSATIDALVPHLKAFHIAMLLIWCGGLFALPLMLVRHDPAIGQDDYTRIRLATHYGYTFVVTAAALFAIGSGTILIFVRDVFEVWLYAKLVAVAFLVLFHVWVGYTVVAVAELEDEAPPPARWPIVCLLVLVLSVLALVLTKPDLEEVPLPAWLVEPIGYELPFDVPRR